MAAENAGDRVVPELSDVAREGEDICRWTFVGDVSGDEMRRLLDLQKQVMQGCAHVLLLIDMARAGTFSAEARKLGAEPANVNVLGTAIFGASFHIRMLAKLVTSASALLRKSKQTEGPVHFVETSAEALAWLDMRREEHHEPGH